jgi:hypothetical protein
MSKNQKNSSIGGKCKIISFQQQHQFEEKFGQFQLEPNGRMQLLALIGLDTSYRKTISHVRSLNVVERVSVNVCVCERERERERKIDSK